MDSSQPAPAVTTNANSSNKKPVRAGDSFARALNEGLNDVAFAFDGAFRPADSLSLAERVAYGLRSKARTAAHHVPSAAARGVPATSADRQVARVRVPRPIDMAPREARGGAATLPAVFEEVRREARLRHASSSDSPNRARQDRFVGCPGLRASAKVGSARLDVIVGGGGRSASVMQWMR